MENKIVRITHNRSGYYSESNETLPKSVINLQKIKLINDGDDLETFIKKKKLEFYDKQSKSGTTMRLINNGSGKQKLILENKGIPLAVRNLKNK